jgi:hypothetical protein
MTLSSIKFEASFALFNKRVLTITLMELADMVTATNSGLKMIPKGMSIPAATGVVTTLWPVARAKFSFIFLMVFLLSVNGYTGDVWYHSWHGEFVRMEEYN